MSAAVHLNPSYYGFIGSTKDALILFQAVFDGKVTHVARRPHDRERESLIKSGNIFIYEENASGIKRWTDGVSWSPSRILGNFLIYRQLEKPFASGEKKKALKKAKGPTNGISKPITTPIKPNAVLAQAIERSSANGSQLFPGQPAQADVERALVGSLVDSYDFAPNGLIKKTISVTLDEHTHHLVSYYTMDHVMTGHLKTPSADPNFRNTIVKRELIQNQNFRAPLEDNMTPTADYQGYHAFHPVPHHPAPIYATPHNMISNNYQWNSAAMPVYNQYSNNNYPTYPPQPPPALKPWASPPEDLNWSRADMGWPIAGMDWSVGVAAEGNSIV